MSEEFTTEHAHRLAAYLGEHDLSQGVGSQESACSIAAINLIMTGTLTDTIPACMSEVLGKWIIAMQDRMPAALRNEWEWKELLPLAAGTGRLHEQERLTLIIAHMWKSLQLLQPDADAQGCGTEWSAMLTEKTEAASDAASDAAYAAYTAAAYAARYAASDAAYAAYAAYAASSAARSAASAARSAASAAYAAYAAYTASSAARYAASDAAYAAYAAYAASSAARDAIDPIGMLRSLVKLA